MNVVPGTDQDIATLQKSLADNGLCRHYFVGNTAYMDYWFKETYDSSITLDDTQIIEVVVKPVELVEYNGYSIKTAVGDAVQWGTKSMPSNDLSVSQPIQLMTLEGGYNIGNLRIEYSQQKYLEEISTSIRSDTFSESLRIGSIVYLDSDYYDKQAKIEICSIQFNDIETTKLVGITV